MALTDEVAQQLEVERQDDPVLRAAGGVRVHEQDAVEVGTGGHQPGNHGVLAAVFTGDVENVPGPTVTFAVEVAAGDAGDNVSTDSRLTEPFAAGEQGQPAEDDPLVPEPPQAPRVDGRGRDGHEATRGVSTLPALPVAAFVLLRRGR